MLLKIVQKWYFRFEYQGDHEQKLGTDIRYPLSKLDLSPYGSRLFHEDAQYSLCAVVVSLPFPASIAHARPQGADEIHLSLAFTNVIYIYFSYTFLTCHGPNPVPVLTRVVEELPLLSPPPAPSSTLPPDTAWLEAPQPSPHKLTDPAWIPLISKG